MSVDGIPAVALVIEDAGVYVSLTSASDVSAVAKALDKLAARLTEKRPRFYSDKVLDAIAADKPLTKQMLGV